MYKNQASQKVMVLAWDTAVDAPKTGDAANITAQISLDGGATAASNDTNPAELDATDAPGIYVFDLTQAETNCDLFMLYAVSATADIKIEPVIAYTMPGSNAGLLADLATWQGSTPNALINGRVDGVLGAVIIDESRIDGACTQAGETLTFTTNLSEATDDIYNNWLFMFTDAGTNQAVPRIVVAYDGTTKAITLNAPLPTTTTLGHSFALLSLGYELHAQNVRDAMKLAPTAGAAAGGSIDDVVITNETNINDIQNRIPAALVSGRIDASVGEMQTTALGEFFTVDSGETFGTSVSGSVVRETAGNATISSIGASVLNDIADAILRRDWTAVAAPASRSVMNALRAIRNRVRIAGGTLTIYEEDDATPAYTAVVTENAAANPITEIDPT